MRTTRYEQVLIVAGTGHDFSMEQPLLQTILTAKITAGRVMLFLSDWR
jgi:hypothetical protein